jgi:hypothetical protein
MAAGTIRKGGDFSEAHFSAINRKKPAQFR